jgi:hypothetical protein
MAEWNLRQLPRALGRMFAAAPAGDGVAEAHRVLLETDGLQFDFPVIAPPEPPAWLVALGRLLGFLQPVGEFLLWGAIALVIGTILYFFLREALRARFPERKKGSAQAHNIHWAPKPVRARALLADADRLAAEGRYDEAVHLLLFRSIDDIEEWRPHLVKPDWTSRDIGMLDVLPPEARSIFARIAEAVEKSFFGGAEVDARVFAECRKAYAGFALSQASS